MSIYGEEHPFRGGIATLALLILNYLERNERLELEEKLGYCFKCAVCASVCPVTLFSEEYATRKENEYDSTYVYDLFVSDDEKRTKIAWKCSLCHHCIEVCPQDIKPGEICTALKEWSFYQHKAPEDIYKLMKSLITDGIIFPISGMTKRKREKLRLPPIKRPVVELEKIAQNTGLRALLEEHDRMLEALKRLPPIERPVVKLEKSAERIDA